MPICWLLFLLFPILPTICSANDEKTYDDDATFYGQILHDKKTLFVITLECEKCEMKEYKTISLPNGQFKIEGVMAEDGGKIGQISIEMKSMSTMRRQIRSNKWVIDEPNLKKLYKFFFGHYTPANVPTRLLLHGKFVGQLPLLSDPNTFYGLLLRKYDGNSRNENDQQPWIIGSDRNIFSKNFMNNKNEEGARAWTNDGAGFRLHLNTAGTDYLTNNERPAMELLLVTTEMVTENPAGDNTFREFGASWNLKNLRRKGVNAKEATNMEKAASRSVMMPNVLNDIPTTIVEKAAGVKGKAPRRESEATNTSGGFGNAAHSDTVQAEEVSPKASPFSIYGRDGTARRPSFAEKVNKLMEKDQSDDDKPMQKSKEQQRSCCFMQMPRMSFRKRSSSGTLFSSPAKSSVSSAKDELQTLEQHSNMSPESPTEKKRQTKKSQNYGNDDEDEHQKMGEISYFESPDLSPMRDIGQQSTIRFLKNPSQKLLRSWSGQSSNSSPSASNRRAKRGFNANSKLDFSADDLQRWSLTRSAGSVRVREVLLTVRIDMPVFMNYDIENKKKHEKNDEEEEYYFIYSFKLPPPNRIEADEVNRQQMREEEMKQDEARKSSASTFLRTSSNSSSVLSRASIYSEPKMVAHEEQFRRALEMEKNEQKKGPKSVQMSDLQSEKSKNVQKTKPKKKETNGGGQMNDFDFQLLCEQKGIKIKAAKNKENLKFKTTSPTASLTSSKSSLLSGRNISSAKGIQIKEEKKETKMAEKEEKKKMEEEQKKKPKKKKKSPKNGGEKGQMSNTKKGKEKGEKAKKATEKKKEEEEEDMEKIWEKIKSSDQTDQQKVQERGTTSGDEFGERKEESTMLREIRQKKGTLKKVSPKKRGKAEEIVAEPMNNLEEQKVKKIGKTESQTLEIGENRTSLIDEKDHSVNNGRQNEFAGKGTEKSTTANAVNKSDETKPRNESEKDTKSDQSEKENYSNEHLDLDLDLTDAEFEHLKEFMAKPKFGESENEHSKIVQIALILSEWLEPEPKPDAFNGFSSIQIEKLSRMLEKLYPAEVSDNYEGQQQQFNDNFDDFGNANEEKHSTPTKSPQNDTFADMNTFSEEEESEPVPLVRKRKGQTVGGNKGTDDASEESDDQRQMNVEHNSDPINGQHSSVGQNDFFGNESPVEVRPHENFFRMVEDDLDAMKSDAESRANIGNELLKLFQKNTTSKEKEKSWEEMLNELFQNINDDQLDMIKEVLNKCETEQQNNSPKKGTKLGKSNKLDSDIDIRTDSELLKKRHPKVTRLKTASVGLDEKLNAEGKRQKAKKSANLKMEQTKEEKGKNKAEDKQQTKSDHHQKAKESLTIEPKVEQKRGENDGQKKASYSEWKALMKNGAERRPTEEEDFEDFFTPGPSPSPTVFGRMSSTKYRNNVGNQENIGQQPTSFLNRQLEKMSLNNWFRGMVIKSDTEQDSERESYLNNVAQLIGIKNTRADDEKHKGQ